MSIFIRLSGGLGNQMFQYALGHELAQKNKTNLLIDLDWFHNIPDGSSYQKERLTFLKCNPTFINSNGSIKKISGIRHHRTIDWLLNRPPIVKEKKHYYFDCKIMNLTDGAYLDGYWQSYKYFSKSTTLRKIFQPNKILTPKTLNYLQQINNADSIAVHIRRGDYATTEKAKKLHGTLPLSYYQTAISLIQSKIKNPTYFIFSDDIKWAKNNLEKIRGAVFIEGINDPNNMIDELYLISQCKHQIIANSSFSWWGAWLNENKNALIISPQKWLAERDLYLGDLIPSNWNII